MKTIVFCLLFAMATTTNASDYALVFSQATLADDGWNRVIEVLQEKYDGDLLMYEQSLDEVRSNLQQLHPKFTCFVAPPKEATREFVASVHRLTRQYDDDPYTDTRWGILTGFDSAGALKIVETSKPLVVRKVAAGTEVALEMCEQGKCYDELVKGKLVIKQKDSKAEQVEGPADSTKALVDTLNNYQPDLFVTSGHATERNWQIGFRYRNGYFKSKAGQMIGQDTDGKVHEIDSPNVKVYMPIGNCLMGHIDGPDAMALAWMNDVGVRQMIGYTVPTWFGYAGWGCLDYFVEQPGRYTFNEAFLANQHALVHKLETTSESRRGLEFDRDVVAFYGDPAWEARMAAAKCAYDQELVIKGGIYTLRVTPNRGSESFQPVNTNGSQRGWRPMVAFLPHRVSEVKILNGESLEPVVADDFVMIPNPRSIEESRVYEVVFQAKPIK